MMPAPIDRFLGEVDAEGGPGALLGLDPASATPASVRAALTDRLARIDTHPQGRSAEADEVRLALHVAAAQVADTIASRGVDRPSDTERVRRPIAPGTGTDPRARTLLAVLAHSGGWNAAARHRFAAVAHAMGLTLDQALALIVAPAPRVVGVEREGSSRPGSLYAEQEPRLGSTPVGRLLLGGAIFCGAASLALVVLIIWLLTQSGSPAAVQPAVSTPTSSQGSASVVPSTGVAATPTTTLSPDADALVLAFGSVGDDVDAFARAYASGRVLWPELEEGALEEVCFACAQAIADGGPARRGMLEVVMRDRTVDAEPVAYLFASGVLARAQDFNALPDSVAAGVERLGVSAGVSPVLSGAGGALVALASREGVDLESWIGAVRALRAQSPPAVRAALAATINRLLVGNGAFDAREQELLLAAAREYPWREEDAQMLIAWWEDERVPTERLALVAQELGAGGVFGLNRQDLITEASTPSDRLRSRDAIARATGLSNEAQEDDPFLSEWSTALSAAREGAVRSMFDDDLAYEIARAAQISSAAALWWAGDRAEAREVLARLGAEEEAPGVARVDILGLTSATSSPDGEWAARYLSARSNDEERLGLLAELRSLMALHGPADADVLARAAMLGASRTVRASAQAVVRGFADDVLLLNALLEGLHTSAAQPDVSDMLTYVTGARLPAYDDRGWRTEARRAVAERLAMTLLRAENTPVQEAEQAVRAAYRVRLDPGASLDREAQSPDPLDDPLLRTLAGSSAPVTSRSVASLCADLWDAWHGAAIRVPEGAWAVRTMSSIERRRAARSAYGSGELQRFTLAQLSLAELMGYLISSERPSESEKIHAVLEESEAAWRASDRVLVQAVILERAMARLWAIRLGVDVGSAEASR